ncbi:hypothetical protein L1049_019596 [Liquidambar formosana]|uniref:Uncharacterized protein n=1 Tax=Liquidambar formosana TaxID=63359 RepID=A0AAP0SBK9_LIQFO
MIVSYHEFPDLQCYEFHVLCVVRGETKEESYMVLHIHDKLIRCNLKDKTCKKLYDLAPIHVDKRCLMYTETLNFRCKFCCNNDVEKHIRHAICPNVAGDEISEHLV